MPPGVASESPSPARRDELIRIAVDVFGRSGYAGARIDEIARRAGIRRPSVLYHFSDKASLYQTCLESVLREIVDRLLSPESRSEDRLDTIVDAWIDFVLDQPSAARLLLRQMLDSEPALEPESAAPIRRLLGGIQAALDDLAASNGVKAIDASEFSLLLSSSSLIWVAGHEAVEGAIGLDTLSPQAIRRHRGILHAMIRELVNGRSDSVDLRGQAERGDPLDLTRTPPLATSELPSSAFELSGRNR